MIPEQHLPGAARGPRTPGQRHTVDAALAAFDPPRPLLVGLSGGADSTALLLACARRWPGQVQALHVHHGLQPAADAFEAHCRTMCAQLQVPLVVQRVQARHAPGESPEAAARHARYQAFDALVLSSASRVAIKSVAIAQHADDQVETVLLALSRGAGVAGLAAMPAQWERAGVPWYRPLLGVPGAALRDWLSAQSWPWVEDPSNAHTRYTRNRIRHQLLPVLYDAFPALRDTVARSARHAAEAAQLLDDLAQLDLAQTGVPPRIDALRALGPARQANALRCWLRMQHATTPTEAQLAALLRQIAACTTRGHRIDLKVGRGFVRRSGPGLEWFET